MTWIVQSHDISPDSPVGSKATALASAQAAGLPVPPFFVVLPSAFEHSLSCSSAPFDGVMPSGEVAETIAAALQTMCPLGEPVAVRSSGRDEDGTAHSHAGQLDSFLDVELQDVPRQIAEVWSSGCGARLQAYRHQHGLIHFMPAPAVIVQRMVTAEAAGVAFSGDPVSGRRGIAVVSAVRGNGRRLVSGECDGDTWHVDRDGQIAERRTLSCGVLSDDRVRAVASLARQAARHFGLPQDIEWAYAAGELQLLQSRAITTLASIRDPDGTMRVWDNSNLVESYSGVTTPMTFSFASEAYEHVYRGFCRLMRVPERTIAAHDDTFRNMIGLVRGRMYYNLASWYRVLALLPGYALNRRFMEQMMGVAEGLPETAGRHAAPRPIDRVRDAWHITRTAAALIRSHLTIDRQVRAFCRRLDAALTPGADLAGMSVDELAVHYRALRRQLLHAWDAPIVNDFLAMVFHGLLRRMVETWCDGSHHALLAALLRSRRDLVSAEPARRLRRLARLAAREPAFVDLLVSAGHGRIAAAIRQHPEFETEYLAYLEKFGERTINELKLETLTLLDDPLPLLRATGRLAGALRRVGDDDSNDSPAASTPDPAARRLEAALARRPVRRVVFNLVLRHARARLHDRERLRLDRTRLFGRVRRIFVELGRRLHADDILDDPRDVFHLTVEEVLAFIEGRSVSASLRQLVALRRREFHQHQQAIEPEGRLESVGVVGHVNAFRRPARIVDRPVTGESRHGLGCCSGIVTGPVRVVTDAESVDTGERCVLVGTHTDPGWVLFFPSALAVVVERGSLLSHTAIVARELGIPAVVSVPNVMNWLKNGDWVEVDGGTGRVQRVPTPATSSPVLVLLKPDTTSTTVASAFRRTS
jgi:rifampicin phosphotransferase